MFKLLFLAASLLIVSATSQAQHIYFWRDANGVPNYSDQPPPPTPSSVPQPVVSQTAVPQQRTVSWSAIRPNSGTTTTSSVTTTGTATTASSGTTTASSGGASLLFSSGFEGSTALSAPSGFYATGGWQDIVGVDSVTGFAWPPQFWGVVSSKFQLIAGVPVTAATIGNYVANEVQTVTGRKGNQTRAMYSVIKQKAAGDTQDPFMIQPANEQGDLYISYWLKFQPDLLQRMTPQTWRTFFEWKTAGDFRVIAYVASYEDGCNYAKSHGPLYWKVRWDNNANGGLPLQEFWNRDNCSVAVPVDEWFKVEVFWHRSSGADGRVWIAINGQVIDDHYGPNKGVNNAPINRIMVSQTYSSNAPNYQWVDDLEIWDGFPPAGNNPPYAPH